MSLNEALSLAQKGGHWQAGADDLQQVQLQHTPHHAPHTKRKRAMGPAGAAPCVPTFLSNNPANMRYTHKQSQKRKFLKVLIHVGRTGNAEQHHALNRGKAIMAALTELQTQGYALEVWAVWRNASCGDYTAPRSAAVHIDTLIKPSTAPWDPALVAFALANISFQRRLCWAAMERTQNGQKLSHQCYGNGATADLTDGDLSLPFMTDVEQDACETPAKALAYVTGEFKKQLERLK